MKDIKFWLIVILAGIIAFMILTDKDPEPNQEKITALENGIAILEVREFQLMEDSAKQAKKIKADSLAQAQDKITYQTTIKKKDAVIANLKANPVVIKVREETPEIDSLLDAMEAKDSIQTARIDTLENDLRGLRVDMAGVNANCSEMLQVERERFALQESLSKEYKQQNRKLRRGNKLLKVAGLVGTVGAFILGGL